MKLPHTLAIAAALALPLAVSAQSGTAPSAAKKELVQKVVRLQQPSIEGLARLLTEQPVAQMLQQASVVLHRVPADQREALARDIQAEAKKYVEDALPVVRDRALKFGPTVMTGILEERFTEDELKQLLAWLESPVSKKFQQSAGEIQKAMSEKIVAEAKPSIEPKIRALEQAVSKRLSAASGAAPSSAPAK